MTDILTHTPTQVGIPDTHRALHGFQLRKWQGGSMAQEKVSKVGRPSKGERIAFNVKLPVEAGKKTKALAKIYGDDAGPLIAERFMAWLATIDLEKERNQEALPIAKAS